MKARALFLLAALCLRSEALPPAAPSVEFTAHRSEFLKREEVQLDEWDKRAAAIKAQGEEQGNHGPDERYRIADDLQLQLKDLRGDLLRLGTLSRSAWNREKERYERKKQAAKETIRHLD